MWNKYFENDTISFTISINDPKQISGDDLSDVCLNLFKKVTYLENQNLQLRIENNKINQNEIRITENSEDIKQLKEENKSLRKEVEMLKCLAFQQQNPPTILIDNPEINSELKESESLYSVEGETIL